MGACTGKLIPHMPDNTDYCQQIHLGPEFTGWDGVIAYVDAEEYGNFTRFANHSCDNNAEFREARVGNDRVIALVAKKTINVGDEVTVDYQDDYFKAFNGRICYGGTAKCRFKAAARTALNPAQVSVLQPR